VNTRIDWLVVSVGSREHVQVVWRG